MTDIISSRQRPGIWHEDRHLLVVLILAFFVWLNIRQRAETARTLTEIAQEQRLSPEEAKALRVCADNLDGKKLVYPELGADTLYGMPEGVRYIHGNIPSDVCVCQARMMAKVFLPGQYSEHAHVADFAVDHAGWHKLSAASLQRPAGGPERAFATLQNSLKTCIQQHLVQSLLAGTKLKVQLK